MARYSDDMRLHEIPDGTIITFDGDSTDFVLPFQVALVGNEAASIRPGTVNRVDKALERLAVRFRKRNTHTPTLAKIWSRRHEGSAVLAG